MHDVSCGGQLRHARTPQDRQIFQRPALGHVTDFTTRPVSRRTPRHVPYAGSPARGAGVGRGRTAVRAGRMVVCPSGPVTPGAVLGLGLGVNFSCVLALSASAPSAYSAVRLRCTAPSAARYRRLLARVTGCSVDDSIGSCFPYSGTVSKICSHPVEAPQVIRARWPLPTGRLVHRQRMDLKDRVLSAQTGVQRDVHSSPMQMPRITARTGSALAGAVGR